MKNFFSLSISFKKIGYMLIALLISVISGSLIAMLLGGHPAASLLGIAIGLYSYKKLTKGKDL